MKILVTGNMGYIGPAVVKRLRASYPQATLVGLDVGYFGNCITNPDSLPERLLNAQYFADVRQLPPDLLNGVDAVVHLAAISNDPIGNKFEEVTLEINHRASAELARKAKDAGARTFVYASSCSIYGAAEDSPRTESSPLNPLTAYAKSKVLTEQSLEPLASPRFRITALRFSTACGWSERLRLDLMLNDFVACALTSGHISILSDGTPWRPLINTKDMARAIDWALSRDASAGPDFLAVNTGRDEWNYQVKDIAYAVAAAVPGTSVSINKDAPPDKRSYRADFGLFKKLAPDHQPELGLPESVQELKAGLESIGFKDGDFRNSRYVRLNVLMELMTKGLLDNRLRWTGA